MMRSMKATRSKTLGSTLEFWAETSALETPSGIAAMSGGGTTPAPADGATIQRLSAAPILAARIGLVR